MNDFSKQEKSRPGILPKPIQSKRKKPFINANSYFHILPERARRLYDGSMEPVLSHTSALEYWKSVRIGSRSFRFVQDARPLLDAPPKKGTLAEPGPWWLKRPLHVLVSNDAARRSSREAVSHVQGGALPPGSVLDSCNGFCVCSPELTFVQMATVFSLARLIELGFELCGTYDAADGDVRECMPLASVDKLASYVASLGRVHGKRKAARALRYVADGSASPRETTLTMLLCLPYALGGYGIEMPLLNRRIDLTRRARRIAGRNYLVCDLFWPDAMLDVEYDGGQHADPEHMSKDSMRRDALLSMGITVVTVTKWQLDDGGSFNGIAHMVAQRLGKQLRYKDPEFTRASLALRSELLRHS